MNKLLALKFARRELRNGITGFRVLILCLALGVSAIVAIGSIRTAIETALYSEGTILLGGNAEAEFTYRFAKIDERKWFESITSELSEVVDFRSMIAVERGLEQEYGLTQIKAVDDAYPLFGRVILDGDISFSEALKPRNGLDSVILERVLMDRLGLEVGNILSIGLKSFYLGGVLQYAPDSPSEGFGIGPRTIVYKSSLEGTGLLEPGTLFSTKYRLKLLDNIDLDNIAIEAKKRFEGSGLRWRDARNAAPALSEFIGQLSTFLILVALAGLVVGGVGVSSAVRSYLDVKNSVIATLRSLGASHRLIFQIYLIQISVLASIGMMLGLILGSLGPLIFSTYIKAALPFPIKMGMFLEPLIEACIYGILVTFIFSTWPLAQLEKVQAATLFRDIGEKRQVWPNYRFLAVIALACGFLIVLAGIFTGSFKLTFWTGFCVLSTLLLLGISAHFLERSVLYISPFFRNFMSIHRALTAISAKRGDVSPVILALGMGLSILATIGQIDGNLRTAISKELPEVAPSYFVLDIQKKQMPALRKILKNDVGVKKVDEAPMLRGIITKINGKDAKLVGGDHWVLQGDRGITYSAAPRDITEISAGTWWPNKYTGPPQISFVADIAKEMELSLGDEMTINILGRDIIGKITSFRNVDFSSAGIGFVLVMNPSALSAAPHSFIATIYADNEAEARILRKIASTFPNVTAIRVNDVIDRFTGILGSISATISFGAYAALLTGFLVLIGTASTGIGAKKYEVAILKTLGASRNSIILTFLIRTLILGAVAGLVAGAAGILGSWALCSFVLKISFSIIWSNVLFIIFCGISANTFANILFSIQALNTRPASVLRTLD